MSDLRTLVSLREALSEHGEKQVIVAMREEVSLDVDRLAGS